MTLELDDRTVVLWKASLVVPGRRSMPGRMKVDCDLAESDPCVLVDTDHPRLRWELGQRLSRS